jgi:hypothetical protein
MKKKASPKLQVDYSAYHNRIQKWKMNILKFYRQIEFNDAIYLKFADNFLQGKISNEQIKKIDELMRIDKANKKKQFEKIKKNRATDTGIIFRKLVN